MSNFIEICFGLENCTNIRIEWLSKEGVQVACDKDNCIRLAPDPYADGEKCIEGWIHCDECKSGNSEPIYFKRCFCTTKADCLECEECKKYGDSSICEGVLTEQQKQEGRLCNGDCPPDKPYFNPIVERCAECIEGSINQDNPCLICVQGSWTLKCENCDKTTAECKECLTNTDCSKNTDGRNCCDSQGKCGCCPGFYFDWKQNKCIPIGPCGPDKECGDCQECVEVIAPDGTITYDCVPIKCPPGTKCINGKQCIPWECESVSCDNGADCGPNCGCVTINGVKQCVPCEILECLGLCAEALGCRCNEVTDKCEGLPACSNPDCDGSSPCDDPNCTCYKQRCVNCGNFPCNGEDGGCTSYANCKCSDSNNCEGGKECKDKIKLTQKENCDNVNGCELEAELVLENKCNCDQIEFKTRLIANTSQTVDPIPGISALVLPGFASIEVKLYKYGVEYSKFKESDLFGDDELVTGTINTIITYQVKDSYGKWINVPETSNIPIRSINVNNIVPIINISENLIIKAIDGKPTRAFIKVIAQNIKVTSNNCISYESKELRTMMVDFSLTASQVQTLLLDYISFNSVFLNDTVNDRKPLFIWYKSIDGVNNKVQYKNNGVYANSGYFRKRYVDKVGSTYKDTIASPVDGLVPNYMYMTKVNCGCNPNNSALTTGPLLFCCPKEYNVKFDNCNTKVSIDAFNVCSVNGRLLDHQSPNFIFPTECQTNYIVIVDKESRTEKTVDLRYESTNRVRNVEINSPTDPIVGIRIAQKYNGGLLSGIQCIKEFKPPVVIFPSLDFKIDCEFSTTKAKVTVQQTSGADLRISDIEYISGNKNTQISLNVVTNLVGGLFVTEIPKKVSNKSVFPLKALVRFVGGCIKYFNIPSCEVKLNLETQGRTVSNKLCPISGTGVVIKATPDFFDNSRPITYTLSGGDLLQPLSVSNTDGSALFNDLGAGTYTGIATQDDLIATSTIVVNNASTPNVSIVNSSICQGETTSINIEAIPGSAFTVYNPSGSIISSPIIPNTGVFTIPNISLSGEYLVTLNNNVDGAYCFPFSKIVTLSIGGQNLTPFIEFQVGNYCINDSIPFRITDGGIGATYTLQSSSGIVPPTLQATSQGFNGTFIPSTNPAYISIISVVGECNTLATTPIQASISGLLQQVNITNITYPCNGDNNHIVSFTAIGAVSAMINNEPCTNLGSGQFTKIVTGSGDITIQATNGSCVTTQIITLNSCESPNYSATIGISGSTCGQGSQDIFYTAYTAGLIGYNYQLQKEIGGVWVDVSGQSGIFSAPPPNTNSFTVNNTIGVIESYRVKFTQGGNTYYTNSIETSSIQPPIISIIGQTVGNTTSTYTFTAQGGVPGVTTYSWSGAGVSGNNATSNPIQFNTPGVYNIVVNTDTNGCIGTASHTITIEQSCANPITASISVSGNTGCQTFNAIASGGSGTLTYEWLIDNVVIHNGMTFSGQSINVGDTVLVTLRVSALSSGCAPSEASMNYTKCAGGCDCNYEIVVIDAVTESLNLTNYSVQILPDMINWVYNGIKRITKTCSGSAPIITNTLIDVLVSNIRAATSGFVGDSNPNITSMNLIDNGVATTLTIPNNYLGNNPQLNWYVLADYLNATLTGIGEFTATATGLRCKIGSSITKGFDYNGGFIHNGNNISYSRTVTTATSITQTEATPCGSIVYDYLYTKDVLPTITIVDLNNVTVVGSSTATRTTIGPNNNPTRTCVGCNS